MVTGDELIRGIAERIAKEHCDFGIYDVIKAFAPFGKLLDAAKFHVSERHFGMDHNYPEESSTGTLVKAIRACEAARNGGVR